jgi:hypothetical protein
MPETSTSSVRPIKYTIVSQNIVRDEVTKLEWQRGVSAAPITVSSGARGAHCRTLEIDGQRGWRLPSTVELLTLLDYAKPVPRIDTTIFVGTPTGIANAGLVGGENSATSGRVNFDSGLIEPESITGYEYYVKCVRSSVAPPAGQRFVLNGAGDEVTDTYTTLVWQKAFSSAAYLTQAQSLGRCVQPWRLPTAKELYTILDPTQPSNVYIDTTIFPGSADYVWSSTDSLVTAGKRIAIDFSTQYGRFRDDVIDGKVRCVK